MVESKGRKAAFLREALRTLEFGGSAVHNDRLEVLAGSRALKEAFDLVSIRAVRADHDLWKTLSSFIKPSGLVLWFRTSGEPGSEAVFFPMFLLESVKVLLPGSTAELAILKRV